MFIDAGAPDNGLHIPPAIVQQIREHQASAPRGHEAVGRIVLTNGGQSMRYDPLTNESNKLDGFWLGQDEFTNGLAPGETPILVHSHPNPSDKTHPSRDDMKQANAAWLGVPYAIFSRKMNQLLLYQLDKNRKGYESLGTFG